MVESEWFFSTLAQSSAALAGLVIAFSAVLYQLERQQREKRTDELRDDLINFKEDYQNVVVAMGGALPIVIGNVTENDFVRDIHKDAKKLKVKVEKDEDVEYPKATLVWAHLHRVEALLGQIEASSEPRSHYLLTREQFDILHESVNWLADFFQDNEEVNELYTELKGESGPSNGDPMFTDVFYDSTSAPDEAGQSASEIRLDVVTDDVKKWLYERFPNDHNTMFTGKNLHSFVYVLRFLRRDFQTINAKRGNTLLDYSSNVTEIIKASGALIIVGVFLPMTFLFTFPQNQSGSVFTGYPVIIVQALLLLIIVGITGFILWMVMDNMDHPS